MNKSIKVYMEDPRGSQTHAIKRKLEDIENDIYYRMGKLQDIKTNEKATKVNLVNCTYLLAGLETKAQKSLYIYEYAFISF